MAANLTADDPNLSEDLQRLPRNRQLAHACCAVESDPEYNVLGNTEV
jgi:hypothetical protein